MKDTNLPNKNLERLKGSAPENQFKTGKRHCTCDYVPDLPTPKTVKSGDFEKKPRKTGRLGSQTWRFPKYELNEIKMAYFLFQGILYHNILAFFSSK